MNMKWKLIQLVLLGRIWKFRTYFPKSQCPMAFSWGHVWKIEENLHVYRPCMGEENWAAEPSSPAPQVVQETHRVVFMCPLWMACDCACHGNSRHGHKWQVKRGRSVCKHLLSFPTAHLWEKLLSRRIQKEGNKSKVILIGKKQQWKRMNWMTKRLSVFSSSV